MSEKWKREDKLDECVAYFKEYSVFHRLLSGFREKYSSYGEFTGKVKVSIKNTEDLEVLEGFFQKNYHGKNTVVIDAKRFMEALAQSRFSEITPIELLEHYFHEKMQGKKKVEEQMELTRQEILQKMLRRYKGTQAELWLRDISVQREGKLLLWRNIDDFETEQKACEEIEQAVQILNTFPIHQERKIYLAVYAAELTGDPHYFDVGTKGYYLLEQMIKWYLTRQGRFQEKNRIFPALEKQKNYMKVGILRDDISNYAILSGIKAIKKDGKKHAGIQGFFHEKDSFQVSVSTLITWDKILCPNNRIYIVENPAIFALLHQYHCGKEAFLCMNGQPRLASILVLDMLKKENTTIYYAGDFDPEGLLIAQKIKQYYGENFLYWHMTVTDYENTFANKQISEQRLKMLDSLIVDELQETVEAIKRTKMAGYQEMLDYRSFM